MNHLKICRPNDLVIEEIAGCLTHPIIGQTADLMV